MRAFGLRRPTRRGLPSATIHTEDARAISLTDIGLTSVSIRYGCFYSCFEDLKKDPWPSALTNIYSLEVAHVAFTRGFCFERKLRQGFYV